MPIKNVKGIAYIVLGLACCYLAWLLSVPQPVQWLPWIFGLTGVAFIFEGIENL